MKVYLDYAATSPVKPEVFKAMKPYFSEKFGNPSSIHSFGQEARCAVDEAREQVAKFLNCKPQEIIFTSGGTEANNLAIMGAIMSSLDLPSLLSLGSHLARRRNTRGALMRDSGKSRLAKPHVIISKIEHHSVLETCKNLEEKGLAEVAYINVDKDGVVDPQDIKKAIKDNTVLVSIMYANNETGAIQPIREIGKMIEKESRRRLEENRNEYRNKKLEESKKSDFRLLNSKPTSNFYQLTSLPQIYFHTDAVQAAGYLDCNVDMLHVDLLTIAGHKIGAPKGIGVLYIRKGIKLVPLMHGGTQEYGLRPGTENVAGIVGLGKAAEAIQSKSRQVNQMKRLRDKLVQGLLKIKDTKINGDLEKSLPNILNISFAGVEGESILLSLDQEGIAASTGSACTSGSLEPSHVIIAMCGDPVTAHSSVRFSLGSGTTEAEIDYVLAKIPAIIKRLRAFSPVYKK